MVFKLSSRSCFLLYWITPFSEVMIWSLSSFTFISLGDRNARFVCLWFYCDHGIYQLYCDPMDCSPPGSSAHGDSLDKTWSGLPCPTPGDLPNPGIEPRSPSLQSDSLPSETPQKPKTIFQFSSVAQSCPTLPPQKYRTIFTWKQIICQ